MRSLKSLLIDLFLIALATAAAQLLRDNFDINPDRFIAILPYLLSTLGVAAIVLPSLGVTRSLWQFASLGDYVRIVAACFITVFTAVTFCFVVTRLGDVARSVPILQCILMVFFLSGARALRRLTRPKAVPSSPVHHPSAPTGLIIGLNRLTELYLHCVGEFTTGHIRIVGLLGDSDRVGLSVLSYPVVGTPEDIAAALRQLEVHGVSVDCVIVAGAPGSLSPEVRAALVEAQREKLFRIEYLAERLVIPGAPEPSAELAPAGKPATKSAFMSAFHLSNHHDPASQLDELLPLRPSYRAFKRFGDVVAASILLVALMPLMLLVALLVALDLGLPVVFWQQRPGFRGRPFKLYKFRTMAAAYDAHGRRRSDQERASRLGAVLRRFRLDELPQLINILKGEMSFVGPRPLLSVEQPAEWAARLMVRPGLTGWAQIKGGRQISIADKVALDIWYVHNMSSALDFKIALGTALMLAFGERVTESAIDQAWRDLKLAGIYSGHDGPRDS